MLQVNMEDVMNVLTSIRAYLIAIGIALAVAIVISIVVHARVKSKAVRRLVRKSTWTAFLAVLVAAVNLICFIPLNSMISLATGNGTITDETSEKATEAVTDIADEGIVLLQNNDSELPLEKGTKLNVFGWASTNPVYGGTGSGALSDAYPTVSLLQGLENAGFELNTELSDFYTAYRADRPTVGMWQVDWTLPEPPADTYSDELIQNAEEFSDTAMIVISRVGGEGADLPEDVSSVSDDTIRTNNGAVQTQSYTDNSTEYRDFEEGEHYLQLSQTEEDMVDLVTSHFDHVILVYNGANTLELGWVQDYPEIQSVIYCPGAGQSGFNSLGSILCGDVNPSGKTADTFVADLTKAPSFNNFGNFMYENVDDLAYTTTDFFTNEEFTDYPRFVNYSEGIYVGYRFWETAAEEGVIDYDTEVVYPFGYGLSYTTFSQEMGPVTYEDGTISFDVTVTNTGDVAGKDVAEVYVHAPYENGGIEKPSEELIDYAKTDVLEPGASQTLSFSFDEEDLASYDENENGCYVLEAGDYDIAIQSDAHNVIDSETITVEDTIVYDGDNKRDSDVTAAVNQFDYAEGDVTYLSRADHFANLDEALAAPTSYEMSDAVRASYMDNDLYNPEDYNNADDAMPTTGADNGLTLADLRGADYTDERWESLLDELSASEMDNLIALAGYQTNAISSIDKVRTVDCDGPASINNNFTGVGSIGFPSAVMIACTWNSDLAEEFGERIGEMADEMDVSGWYAPALNIHRSAFGGRDFEYYSEDPVLAGSMGSNAILGAAKYGVYAYAKHFAVNDQETNRTSRLSVWTNEQALREIYLKPFEMAVKEGGTTAIMSSYSYLGPRWAGASSALLQTVLRGEWGFNGMVVTDYFGDYDYMDADQAIRGGTDAMLIAYDTPTNHVTDQASATGLIAMRNAAKDILYTVVNSRAYDPENLQTGLMTWQRIAIVLDVIIAALLVLRMFLAVRKYKKQRTEEKAAAVSTAAAAVKESR